MPWKKDDVEKHKKGLNAKQKEKWVSVANSVRAECIKNGGNEKDCDAKAIRTANSQIKNNVSMMERITTLKAANSYKAVTKEKDGKTYLVVPVVMIREGVHNGSAGAIFHEKEKLQNSVDSWANKPVTIGHPVNQDGEFVSVNEDGISDNWVVGFVTNTRMEDDKLKSDAWLDVVRLAAISPITLQMVQESEVMEVSVGVFAEEEELVGYWNNEEYRAVANNYVPDHLALLPGETGACSITDGCGIRVNVNKKKGGFKNVKFEVLKELEKQGLAITPIINEASFDDIRDQLWSLMESNLDRNTHSFIEAIYDKYFIYHKREYETNGSDEISSVKEDSLYKQMYSITADDKVELSGDPVKVKKSVSYVTLKKQEQDESRNFSNNNKKKEVEMCEKCPEKVDALIAHKATNYTESDRTWLQELDEDKLDRMIPRTIRANEEKPEKKEVSVEEAWKVVQANSKGLDDYLENLPDGVKTEVKKGLEVFKEQREAVVKKIMDNSGEGVWTEDELGKMDFAVLQKIEKTLSKTSDDDKEGDYSGQGAGGDFGAYSESDIEPYVYETDNKKE